MPINVALPVSATLPSVLLARAPGFTPVRFLGVGEAGWADENVLCVDLDSSCWLLPNHSLEETHHFQEIELDPGRTGVRLLIYRLEDGYHVAVFPRAVPTPRRWPAWRRVNLDSGGLIPVRAIVVLG